MSGPEDFHRFQPGDVLITHTTTPIWTTLFNIASAAVTEVGGPFSHAAIVAREFGIPLVNGAMDATRVIQDGTSVNSETGRADRPFPPADSQIGEQMKTVLVRSRINAPPDQVFLAIADPHKPFLTSNPITHLEIVGERDRGVGTIYRWTFTLPLGAIFRFEEVVTGWAEAERFAYQAISGWEMEAESRLIPEKGQTRLDFSLGYRFPGLWGWLVPAWLVRLGIRRSLANLQKRFETRAGRGTTTHRFHNLDWPPNQDRKSG